MNYITISFKQLINLYLCGLMPIVVETIEYHTDMFRYKGGKNHTDSGYLSALFVKDKCTIKFVTHSGPYGRLFKKRNFGGLGSGFKRYECEIPTWFLRKLRKDYNENKNMDIGSKCGYPASSLSNFAPHPFEIDGVKCNSMEGFLQSLKYKSVEMQEYVCTLVGYAAKKQAKGKNWKVTQTLYWRGVEYKRDSKEYQDLLDRAYDCLYTNTGFKDALEATKDSSITHSIGKNKENDTVLTEREFCSRLYKLRERLNEEKKEKK